MLRRGVAGVADIVVTEATARLQAARQARKATAGLPLPAFVDARYAGPEPRVSASLLCSAIDVVRLRGHLEAKGCPTALWQGQVLLCGSCEAFEQQLCSAVFLPDGCVVCWHMSRATEQLTLELASRSLAHRRGPARLGAPEALQQPASSSGSPLATEELDVVDAVADATTSINQHDGCVQLTVNPQERSAHQIGLSLGLASAVRLEALEKRIERQLEVDWRDMRSQAGIILNLSSVSRRIFLAENTLHELRYELNSEAGSFNAADLLWDHAPAERLYDKVVAHFDLRRRTAILNERLSYSFDFLHTLGEHVRHLYSVRLERMIILLIFLELIVGIVGLQHGSHSGSHGSGAKPPQQCSDMDSKVVARQ